MLEWLIILILLTVASITVIFRFASNSPVYEPAKVNFIHKEIITGKASWYDYSLNGIVWSKDHHTAASRDLKRYSKARVTNLANNKSTIVFINDYGPDASVYPDRIIDLSSHAFNEISDTNLGIIDVKITSL